MAAKLKNMKTYILKKSYGSIGNCSEVPYRYIHVNGAKDIYIGNFCSIGPEGYFEANKNGKIIIGDGSIIAPKVTMITRTHRYDGDGLESIPFDRFYLTGDINVEEGVWIGQGAFILPGVRIGRGSVVAAGCVVAKSVPRYTVVAGNPAKIVGRRDSDRFEKLFDCQKYNKKAFGKKEYIKMSEKEYYETIHNSIR